MKLENHIVRKVLENPTDFTIEVMEALKGSTITEEDIESDKFNDIIPLVSNKDNRTYYITKSVIDKLELLDTKKCIDYEGWKLFAGLPDFKKTYILPDLPPDYAKYGGSGYVRIFKRDNIIHFLHITSKFLPPNERTRGRDSDMYIVLLYIDMREDKKEMCTHWNSADGKSLAPFLYALMCFVELCDNEVIIVEPKAKYGTQKTGKIINTTPFPITVINNTWNTTTITSGGFTVSGHAHIYWTGTGRAIPKLVFVEPYEKRGYTRRSGKELQANR